MPKLFLHSAIVFYSKGSGIPFRLTNSQGQLSSKEYKISFACRILDFPLLISREFILSKYATGEVKIYPIGGIDQGYLIRAINKMPRLNQMDELIYNTFNLLALQDPRLLTIPITTNRYQVGFAGGVETKFAVKKKYTFFTEDRYAYFFTPVFVTMQGAKIYNRAFTINTGMLF